MDKVDLEIIEEIATLDPSNDNEFFKNQVVRFREFAQEQLYEMKEGIDKKDRAMIEACAHSIGGGSSKFWSVRTGCDALACGKKYSNP